MCGGGFGWNNAYYGNGMGWGIHLIWIWVDYGTIRTWFCNNFMEINFTEIHYFTVSNFTGETTRIMPVEEVLLTGIQTVLKSTLEIQ
jgi:hypothetical protein